MYMTAPSLHTCCFTSAIPFPSIFTKSPDEIVVEAVDFVEAIVLTARRNTLVISPYCVISLVKIFIFIEWALFHSRSLCYVIKSNIIAYCFHIFQIFLVASVLNAFSRSTNMARTLFFVCEMRHLLHFVV